MTSYLASVSPQYPNTCLLSSGRKQEWTGSGQLMKEAASLRWEAQPL